MSRSSSSGGPTGQYNTTTTNGNSNAAPSSSPALMSINAHLQCSVEQCLDAICFSGTHQIDSDLRAQPKASIASIDRLVQEQQRRVEDNFGSHTLPAESHAMMLDELFKIDSCSINYDKTDDSGQQTSSVVEIMTDTTAKIFKKEMKQRIHDWEGAFREMNGREPTPQDKNRLKHIYELYKIVKNRVLRGGGQQQQQQHQEGANTPSKSGSGTATATTAVAPTSSGAQQRAPSPSTAATSSGVMMQQSTPVRSNAISSSSAMPSPSMTPAPASSSQQPAVGAGAGSGYSGSGSNTPMVALTPMGAATPNAGGSQTGSRPGSAPSQYGQPGSSSSSRHATPTAAGASSSPPGGATTPRSSYDALVTEKRTLKRKLHAFEADFAKQHGRPPTREDRLPLIQQYQRYGELKIAIQAYGSSEGGGHAED